MHGEIQMSAAKGKICGQNPQRGEKESVQIPQPLHLKIDTTMYLHKSKVV